MPKIQVDICSACHPFYTGEMRFVDTQGRVEKFQQKMQQNSGAKYVSKKQRKNALASNSNTSEPRSLGEMIQEQRQKSKDSQ